MQRPGKKYWIAAAALVATAVLVKTTIFAPVSVKVTKLVSRDLTAQVYGNGTVEAKIVVGISSKITGKIVELQADQGDLVKQGSLLARLENDDLSEQVRQAEASVLKAQAAQNVEAATLQKALANVDLAKKNAERFERLLEKDYVPKKDTEELQVAFQVAKEEVSRAHAALESARMDEKLGTASQRFAQAKLADARIYAPSDGLILSRDLEQGAIVTPGQTIFQFTDPRTVWIKANVDESHMAGVRVGNAAIITLRSAPGEQFPGRVARIGRQSDRVTEESEVDVIFEPPIEHFRLGEQADVFLVTGAKNSVPSLPSVAIASRGKTRGVWVLKDGRLGFKAVDIGIEDRRDFVEVRSGLEEGEQIVVAPTQAMSAFADGQRAKVLQ
ncbi:efflux RND transporter periplasmic adaptor subunit [Desulfovibrio sp. TomC]|uniref:efflux RND transporter periplasmic adaptor subunit n=1 Tax=Desulfovibrio sp. TomC TaxID=1562888 RepID=UPI000575822F|nr:efflux RND transporter periplasmic adaptor subunit [Desulfovibrio sp. TomC]KHK01703.1 putative RND efflux membrane fusion protein [Desulfovibrio sp. TomC]